MAQQIHYEVHVNKSGRWSISSNFNVDQMEAAIAQGKNSEKLPGIRAVKVIRNVFNPRDGIHQEFLIYKSANLSYSKVKKPSGVASDNENQLSDQALTYIPNVSYDIQEKVLSLATIFIRLLIVMVFSLGIAGILTYVTSTILRLLYSSSNFNLKLTRIAEADILFVTFCVTFLLSLAYISFKFVRFTSTSSKQKVDIGKGKHSAKASNPGQKEHRKSPSSYSKLKREQEAARKMASVALHQEEPKLEFQNRTLRYEESTDTQKENKNNRQSIENEVVADKDPIVTLESKPNTPSNTTRHDTQYPSLKRNQNRTKKARQL